MPAFRALLLDSADAEGFGGCFGRAEEAGGPAGAALTHAF
ncbi:hypothetical protein AGRO_3869 [Agrobacterium sp. ATCC 31749]|nr:hypothetical protein AGRO_3869 [Agrobacterium sp. ATCC 31749]